VRTIEKRLPEFAQQLSKTVALPERQSLIKAMTQCIKIYLELRTQQEVAFNQQAQQVCTNYFIEQFQANV